ncbi:MAG: EAL domain-containing protein [Lachnospiraceae bacterium]|nr:EAL domain-containing protein [Lachnospiraceae bacterium]MBR4413396.1 EAL domain-containing protein [Lachnospiraceae bacterium]MBR5066306.1 EAL domain-containing protein [Lachnospiraceae bacterium]MBR5916677.1 EAL domain-containing protein [Lachnospiraceae bacterium]
MANTPKRKKNKVLKIVTKNHIWLTIVLCVIIAFYTALFVKLFSDVFSDYILNTKFMDEYEKVEYMSKLYDLNIDNNGENVYSLLNEEGRNYFISDNLGNVIYHHGEITMGENSGYISIPVSTNEEKKIKIYFDEETDGLFYSDEEGDLKPRPIGLLLFGFEFYEKSGIKDNLKKASIDLPMWMTYDVQGGKQTFTCQILFKLSLMDGIFLASFIVISVALVACIIVLLLVNMINTLVNQKRLSKVFFTDPITRGHNWMWFSFRGEQLLKKRRSAKESYAVLDLVFVKFRNYCVCHSVIEGEEMLYRVDKIINQSLNKKEMAAHYASANFALLLKFKDREELRARIQQIIDKLEVIGRDHKFTFHVGVYVVENRTNAKGKPIRRKNIDIEREYNNACTARLTLEECDDSGIAFFDENLVEEQKWIDTVMERRRSAIENEEYVIYYQPKYDPKNNKLRGVEALIRWNSPDLGFKGPGTFIPILEKNGFIQDIDHYMITHVARDQKAWLDAGYECVPASVNVSRAHFSENDLAEQIRDAVDAEGCPRNLLEIELTESAFFDDKKAMIDTILKLKEYGFMVSMDDFGSGYSSLNSLKDMPLDILKLDAEFFRGDTNGGRGEIVITEAIALAKSLNMLTVAEGVEFKEQVEFLASKGCDMIQGYFFAKPMPKEEYADKMNRKEGFVKEEETTISGEELSEEETGE